ncbi:MAG: NADH-quinone oxidoreductase subunit B family protein [Ferrovum sp.]|nr:NADH-quinone oxidoreductase subunit B family protein [Ferrovum sp.]NDU86584.1 NADH-quinone oxidoreductase subunit B family protein [Ferrovum sp.]
MAGLLRQILSLGLLGEALPPTQPEWMSAEVDHIQQSVLRHFGRSLGVRLVDAGSCNGCELEIHALNSPQYNLAGAGIRFVASPRHADILLVTGPVSRHMEEALKRTYDAIPAPKWVVAVGDCGATGGLFGESYAVCGGVSRIIPVTVTVPGCPPSPLRLLQGILTAVSGSAPNSLPPQPE